MFEEMQKLIGITGMIRLLHLPPALRPRDAQAAVQEKAYLMQVRLDLESKTESAIQEG